MSKLFKYLQPSLLQLGIGVATVMTMSPAWSFPLLPVPTATDLVTNVRIVCDADGNCIRQPHRRPVARWFYGDRVFSGPYVGPGNYGDPARHARWLPLFLTN